METMDTEGNDSGSSKKAHDDPLSAHGGINKTLYLLRKFYFWPNMVVDVKKFVNGCEICMSTKHPNQPLRPPMGKTGETHRFFRRFLSIFWDHIPDLEMDLLVYL